MLITKYMMKMIKHNSVNFVHMGIEFSFIFIFEVAVEYGKWQKLTLKQ